METLSIHEGLFIIREPVTFRNKLKSCFHLHNQVPIRTRQLTQQLQTNQWCVCVCVHVCACVWHVGDECGLRKKIK